MEEKSTDLRILVEPLLQWYGMCARVLPWREDPSPYRVWISEIMLQQTRVEAGKPYFERFVAALPDVYALADCPEEQLLKLWEGLGYYNRVRNLQKAARLVVEQYGGALPSDPAALQSLPGIGAYTAGAIASIAFGLPVPAVDGNVLRVWARFTASRADIGSPAVKRMVQEQLRQVYPAGRAGDFSQALMELGALVCLPNGAPACNGCPLQRLCRSHAAGIAHELPVKAVKKPRRVEERTVLLLVCGDRAALQKRPETGLLAGLWEFPSVEGKLGEERIFELLREEGLSPIAVTPLPPAKHIFSHVEWHMGGFWVEAAHMQGPFSWVDVTQLRGGYAAPSAYKVYHKLLCERLDSHNNSSIK